MEAKNLIREYLEKLQELQMKAFDKGINMKIGPRQDSAYNGAPWLVVDLYMEGCDFVKDPPKERPTFYFNLSATPKLSRRDFDVHIKSIADYIENHGAWELGDLPIGAIFTIPGATDELPTEGTGSGHHYLYCVSSRKSAGKTRVFNKDLLTFSYLSDKTKVNKL